MQISFHGAAGCVTGSCYLIETSSIRFLVDCGMFQGNKTLKENNYKDFAFDPTSIDFVLITHAHIDHTGLLPKLVKHGFSGKIYATEPTVDLLQYLLPDSAHIQEVEVMRKNVKNDRKGLPHIEPIYDALDADKAIGMLNGIRKEAEFEPGKGCKVRFHNAGHVLGSAFIEINLEDEGKTKKLVFSGDLGEKDHPIVEDPGLVKNSDILVVESTYGNRNRERTSKEERLNELSRIFNEAIKRGGNLIIPSFALERTQDLMHDIMVLRDKKAIPFVPVIIDSPLATSLTKVFVKYPRCYDEDAREIMKHQGSLFDHGDFQFTASAEESMALNGKKGLVILSASGMCDAGRIKHHLKHNLWSPENTVLFVGYQAEGTLGRLLSEGNRSSIRIHGEEVALEAKIEIIHGYSGHADQHGLMNWIESIQNISDAVFVTHGEVDASAKLAELITEKKGFKTITPSLHERYNLSDLESTEPKEAPKEFTRDVPSVYAMDSHNMYAELMLAVSDFMRSTTNEEERKITLKKLFTILKK